MRKRDKVVEIPAPTGDPLDMDNYKARKKAEKMAKRAAKGRLTIKQRFKNIVSLYDELIFCQLIGTDSTSCRFVPQQPNKIGVDFLATYDGPNLIYYYVIDKFPTELFIDFKQRLRRECRPGVRVNFYTCIRPHVIEWESPQMTARLRILGQVADEVNESDINAYNYHSNVQRVGRQDWIEESLVYLADADRARGRALEQVSIMVTVSGERGEDFNDSVKVVENTAKHMGLLLSRVKYEIPQLLQYFSPFKHTYTRDTGNIVPVQVITDEILSRFNTYSQGTLGNKGIYWGTDVYSRFPVIERVKATAETAENWLITAETGGGKSFAVKALLLQLLGMGYNGTIMDIEGFEYIPLANFISHSSKVQVLNMGEGSGKYFDPVEIAALTGIEDIDKDAKKMSVDFTTSTFRVLLGRVFEENYWLDTVINDAVSLTYQKAGVTEDRATWPRSIGLTLHDVYSNLAELKGGRDDPEYDKAISQALAFTSRYFEEDGTRSELFRERVLISDLVDADLVICSFGMAGKSPQSIDPIQLNLMQMGAAQLSHQRSIFSKSRGRFNFKLWEEFQRWGKFPDADKTIGVALTGGRKLGDVNVIVTNKVSELLTTDTFGIFDNITSFMCGAIADSKVREEFCLRMSIPLMIKELDRISSAARVVDDEPDEGEAARFKGRESIFAYSFLVGLNRNKYAITRMELPEALRASQLFRTGVDLKGPDVEDEEEPEEEEIDIPQEIVFEGRVDL